MLVVENNGKPYWYTQMSTAKPLQYYGDCIVVIDPSKTNMAVLVGDTSGIVLGIVEFSGNNRRNGPAQDTTLYCIEFRKYLQEYLANCHVHVVGVEQALQYEGIKHYRSSMTLTEIRGNILEFFSATYGKLPIEINNWSWKSGILPAGYRSQSEKGSKRWIVDTMPNTPWANFFEADVTDVLCMYWYLLKIGHMSDMVCTCSEEAQIPFNYYFEPVRPNNANLREVIYNDKYSVIENCNYYVNRVLEYFCMMVSTSQVPIDLIYGHCDGFTFSDISTAEVRMVIGRSG